MFLFLLRKNSSFLVKENINVKYINYVLTEEQLSVKPLVIQLVKIRFRTLKVKLKNQMSTPDVLRSY